MSKRYRPERGDVLIAAGVGWKSGVIGKLALAIDSASPAGRAMQTARPVFRTTPSSAFLDHGIISALNVPSMVDSRTWGVLEVDAGTPRTFHEDDVTFLTTVANILGLALLRYEMERKAQDAATEYKRDQERADVLLRELQHRAKNNLQTIVSFLSLQRRQAESAETREKLASVMDRVHAIALAHDQLAVSKNAGQVDFGDYLRALCANIDPQREGLMIEVDVSTGFLLPLDRAVPAGLIVNELVTNSLKYAFDEAGGTIGVEFTTDPDRGEAYLVVQDNGRGMKEPRQGRARLVPGDGLHPAARRKGRPRRCREGHPHESLFPAAPLVLLSQKAA